jgi:hypothetical protein
MRNKQVIQGIMITVMLLFLISCEKEKPLSEAIIGKWEVVSMKVITYESNVKKAEATVYLEANEMKYQFIDGGSGIFWDEDEDFLFSWTLSGSQITISDLYEKDMVVNASVDDDILTWTNKETDPQVPNRSYEYVLTAERLSK